MPARSEAPLAAAIGRRPQSSSEIIGSGDRRSCRTNSTTATTATRVVSPISSRPEVESAVRSAMMAAMATVNMPALRWSILPRPRTLFSCKKAQNPAAARAPIGKFIQKIQAQEKYWMMRPPARGPKIADTAQTLASQPWIFPRSCGE